MTLDDVTSGFNIGENVSLESSFHQLLGFSEQDVRHMLEYYHIDEKTGHPVDEILTIMREWCDNYCFSRERMLISSRSISGI